MTAEKLLKAAWSGLATAVAAVLLTVAAAGGAELVKPAYPEDSREKPFEVNVVICAPLDGGVPGEARVIYKDGADAFEAAATAALEKSTFDAARERVTIWYTFRLLRETEVVDASREPERKFEVAPELLSSVAPTFPPGAPSLRTEVSLDLFVGPDGNVWYAEEADGGANPLYVERAIAAARQFKPES